MSGFYLIINKENIVPAGKVSWEYNTCLRLHYMHIYFKTDLI